ncbi:MAG TPA: cytochrome D1 domain-containing protein [Thermoanaerobaculia bacterium]|nr:cytochrome D1 domain-containing protein [Thermoanaerobaculia bacterium]
MKIVLTLLLALPLFADRLYVSNERSGTIQIIDTSTDRVIGTAKIGDRPRGLALSPDGKRLYAAVSWWRDGKRARTGQERIAAFDAQTLKLIRDYASGTDPECVAVSTDGARLYISNEDAGTASIIDAGTGKHRATLVVGTEPEGVTASPDGRWVYVTAETSNVVTVIDTKQERVAANILVDPRPRVSIFTKDGSRAWVSAEIGGTVQLVDAKKHRIVKRVRLGPADKPVGMVLSPDEKRLYVATGRGNGVAVVDTVSMRVIATIPTGVRVWGIALTRDGRKLYAANSLSNTISVINTATNRVVKTIKTDDGPWALVSQR